MKTLTHEGNSGDVSATLGELERKLRELEQELARVGHPAAPAAPAPPVVSAVPPPAPAPPAIAEAPPLAQPSSDETRRAALEHQLDQLRQYGDELQASAGRLLDAYRQALADLDSAPMAMPAPAAPPPVAPAPAPPVAAAAPIPAAVPPAPAAQAPALPVPPAPPVPAPIPAAQVPAPAAPAPLAAPVGELPPFAGRPSIAQGQQLPADLAAQFAAAQPVAGWPGVAPEEARQAGHEFVAPAPGTAAPPAAGAPAAPPAAHRAVVTPDPGYVVPAAHADRVEQTYFGVVTVDAGPFVDIASLSDFEQAIARVSGVRDVYVRGFQGQRAIIDVDFGVPTTLIPELAAASPIPFTVNGADATGLVVTIHSAAPHG